MKPEEVPSWEPFLKRIPLFAGLSPEDWLLFIAWARRKVAWKTQPPGESEGVLLLDVAGWIRDFKTWRGDQAERLHHQRLVKRRLLRRKKQAKVGARR